MWKRSHQQRGGWEGSQRPICDGPLITLDWVTSPLSQNKQDAQRPVMAALRGGWGRSRAGPGFSGGGPRRRRIPEPRPPRVPAAPARSRLAGSGSRGASGRGLGLRFQAWGRFRLPDPARSWGPRGAPSRPCPGNFPQTRREVHRQLCGSRVSGAIGRRSWGASGSRPNSRAAPAPEGAPPSLYALSSLTVPFITFAFLRLTPPSLVSRGQPLSSSPFPCTSLGLWGEPPRRRASLRAPGPCLLGKRPCSSRLPPFGSPGPAAVGVGPRLRTRLGAALGLGPCTTQDGGSSAPLFSQPRAEGARSSELRRWCRL
nr:transcription initiation factor TFIID subunit 4-like [Microcebus murinus]